MISQDFRKFRIYGLTMMLKVRNVFNTKEHYMLNTSMQTWEKNTYYKPNEVHGFGRQFIFQATYEF